ncbi:MAG: cell division protein FtsQ/DivIB [Actinomycetota bacterium]
MARRSTENKKILKRRRRVLLRKFWQFFKILLALVFLAVAIYGLNYFYDSQYFKIEEIIVEGNDHYTYEDINNIAGVYLGTNIFEINKKGMEDKLTSKLYWLKGAELKKVFPDKLIIKVKERKPFIIINYGKSFYLLDEEGVVIDKLAKEELEGYKKIVVKNVLNYHPNLGDKIAKKNVLSCGFIYQTMDMETRELFSEAIIEEGYGDIAFITGKGKRVIFGTSENVVQKITIFKEVLKDDIKFNIIDISNYRNPVIIK